LPFWIVQIPPQQSAPVSQMSPFCPQYDGCEQILFSQKSEQQSPFCVHAFPSVEHVVLSGVHFPFVPHVPLQHCESWVQV
jgi:hypothetical protein